MLYNNLKEPCNNLKVIRKPEAYNLAGISKTTFYEQRKSGLFAPPISIGSRAIGYILLEIQTVIAARAIGKSDDEIRMIVKALIKNRETTANVLFKQCGLGEAKTKNATSNYKNGEPPCDQPEIKPSSRCEVTR